MGEYILDGLGNNYVAKVGSDNRLWVDTGASSSNGSVSYIPAGSVIVTNTVAISGNLAISTGSVVYQGTSPWIIAGSISSMPNINVSTGSESWIKNFGDLGSSVVVTNLYAGSEVYQNSTWGVSGNVNVNNFGSEFYVKAGSVNVNNFPNIFGVSGNVDVNNIGSVTYQSIDIGSTFSNAKTILVYSGASIGSIFKITTLGSYVKVLDYSGPNLVSVGAWVSA